MTFANFQQSLINNGILSSVSGPYSLPNASSSTLGGVKVGSGLTIDGSGILSAINSSAIDPNWTLSGGNTLLPKNTSVNNLLILSDSSSVSSTLKLRNNDNEDWLIFNDNTENNNKTHNSAHMRWNLETIQGDVRSVVLEAARLEFVQVDSAHPITDGRSQPPKKTIQSN